MYCASAMETESAFRPWRSPLDGANVCEQEKYIQPEQIDITVLSEGMSDDGTGDESDHTQVVQFSPQRPVTQGADYSPAASCAGCCMASYCIVGVAFVFVLCNYLLKKDDIS